MLAATGTSDPRDAEEAYKRCVEARMDSILETVRGLAGFVAGAEGDKLMSTAAMGDVGEVSSPGTLAHSLNMVAHAVEAKVP